MNRRPRPSVGLALLDAGYVLLAAALALVAAWPIYQHPQALVVGGVGIGIGLVCALGGRLLRLPVWADLLAAVLLYVAVVVPVAIPSAFPDRWLTGLRDGVAGIVTGWKSLVTVELPLGDYQAVLVPLLVVTLFGTYAAARIAMSAERVRPLASVVLLGMFGFGIAFGSSALGGQYAPSRIPALPLIGVVTVGKALIVGVIVLALLSIIWLAVRARRSRAESLARAAGVATSGVAVRRTSRWAVARRALLAVAMLGVAVVAAGFVAVPAVQAERQVIRDHVEPVELESWQTSPLAGYRSWLADDRYDAELFTVAAPTTVDRLRLAVMDVYDGTRFAVSSPSDGSRFARLDATSTTRGETVRITIGPAYGQPWVPLPGDRSGPVSFPAGDDRALDLTDRLYYATDDSMAVVLGTLDGGAAALTAGDRIDASGAPQTDARERIAEVPGGGPLHGITAEAYPQLTAWVDAQQAGSGGSAVLELIDRLRERGYLSHGLVQDEAEAAAWFEALSARAADYEFQPSRAGHSTQRIEALFTLLNDRAREAAALGRLDDPAAVVAGIGDDEQFAAAAALLAWSQGVPARVVLGVRLPGGAAAQADPAGVSALEGVEACEVGPAETYRCLGRHVAAWLEIGVGGAWLPVDVGPQFAQLPSTIDEGATPPEHGTLPERPASNVVDPPSADPTRVESQAAPEDAPGPILSASAQFAVRVAVVAGSGLGLVLIPPFLLIAGKALRRSRRRAASPEVAIVGAFEELVDDSVDLGLLPAMTTGTRSRIATQLDGDTGLRLAEIADRAVFGPTAPTDSDREHAWHLLGEERRRRRRAVPFGQRLRAALNPASLLRHLRRTRRTLDPGPVGGRA